MTIDSVHDPRFLRSIWKRVGAALALLLAVVTVPASAQTITATTGTVTGIVTDTTTSVVPGVAVRLSGSSLLSARATTTDQGGGYGFPAVPPGVYTLTFELAGFGTVVREGVHVGIGFAASVHAELQPAGLVDSIVVGGTPVVDVASATITTPFDSERLAALPGARDTFAVLASTPGVAMAKMDVGGSGALTMQEFTAYGLRATTGMHRNEVEGIRVGGANGANDNYASDFASFSEIAVKAAGNSAAMPVPGTLVQYVSKAGGNAYRGSLYADVQRERWQARNVDDQQIASGVAGGPGLAATDVNRLQRFRDVTADVGGFLKKDRAWWYAAYRDTVVGQRFPWLIDAPATLTAAVATGKLTYQLSRRQTLVAYLQHERFEQSSYFLSGISQPIQSSDALPRLEFPVSVWKGEYTAAVSDALFVEVRSGAYLSAALQSFKSTAPRIADTGANLVRGGSFAAERLIDRPQVNGSLSFVKRGWSGSHTFRLGGELMVDRVDAPHFGYGNGCNCISTLNNGVPSQVQLFLGTNVSKNELVTKAGFIDDTWRIGRRLTASLGVRLDRYQPGLPEQQGPAGQTFAAVAPVLTFDNWGPRAGLTADLTGSGRTVLKLHYGKFWLYPGANFTGAFNPNPSGWSRTHLWTADANGNGWWDPGEEGPLSSLSGGRASTTLDADIVNTHVHQFTAYLERQVAGELAVRTGVVVNARRQPYGTINASRPLSAYSLATTVADPGPDGRAGSGDEGPSLVAYGLAADALGTPPVNLTTNLPLSDSDYYTWEVTATKRESARWSLLASVTHTWNREGAMGMGSDFTPNALINTTNGQLRFTTWQAKLHATLSLPFDLRLIPLVRIQSGTPFARTFAAALNYGNATIKADAVTAHRTSDIALVDLRSEKSFHLARTRLAAFADVYNLFNTNAEQTLTSSSGAAWLRPTSITGPRILRLGARLEW